MIRVYDDVDTVFETHETAPEEDKWWFKKWRTEITLRSLELYVVSVLSALHLRHERLRRKNLFFSGKASYNPRVVEKLYAKASGDVAYSKSATLILVIWVRNFSAKYLYFFYKAFPLIRLF